MQNVLTFLRQVYLLEVVGGFGVTCLGWVVCHLTGSSWLRSAPLWLGGYLLVYNFDRLHYDPADQVNTPTPFSVSGIAAVETVHLNLAQCRHTGGLAGSYWPLVAYSSNRTCDCGIAILFTANSLGSKTIERSPCLKDLYCTTDYRRGSSLVARARAQTKLRAKRDAGLFLVPHHFVREQPQF